MSQKESQTGGTSQMMTWRKQVSFKLYMDLDSTTFKRELTISSEFFVLDKLSQNRECVLCALFCYSP